MIETNQGNRARGEPGTRKQRHHTHEQQHRRDRFAQQASRTVMLSLADCSTSSRVVFSFTVYCKQRRLVKSVRESRRHAMAGPRKNPPTQRRALQTAQ